MSVRVRLTYVGGPTALIEIGGLRLLTDPTFDPAGSEYPTPFYVLRKTQDPALAAASLGRIDFVLLSHDHHADNLDGEGRRVLGSAGAIITTADGAGRLGGRAIGLLPWEHLDVSAPLAGPLRITATPARHGPSGGDRGPVIGFAIEPLDHPGTGIYISGDTVWYEGIAEVSRRFTPAVAVLFGGAARVREVGPAHLTFTAAEMVTAAAAFSKALVVPLHAEGWMHFSESRGEIARAFEEAGLTHRVWWPAPGEPVDISGAP
jgi:L-ascorbate metabolism protein UlaG (beta-lactamase superfamily)